MAEVLFVSPNYLKKVTQLNGSVDENYISQAVIIAQDKHLQTYLGSDLYDALKARVTAGTVTGLYATLMDAYVRKATAWWTMVELLPTLNVKIENGGLMIYTGDNKSAISTSDLHREIERCRANAHFYTAQMYKYLCHNTAGIPEYSTNTQNRLCAQPFVYYQNGLTFSQGAGRYTRNLELYSVC